jgi:hypothetical protein
MAWRKEEHDLAKLGGILTRAGARPSSLSLIVA